MRRLLCAAAFMALAQGARAEAPPVQDWSHAVETVVVTARMPGPLMWRVRKADATVYLLGLVEPVPEDFSWDDTGVRLVLKGARQLLLPPKASVGIIEGLWFLAWNSDSLYLPDDTPMESTLSANLRARFVAARQKIHRDAGRYAGLRVPLAGLRLENDFFKAHDLTNDEPQGRLRRIARGLGVPVRAIADYGAIPLLKQLPNLSRSTNETCMTSSLDDMDAIGAHAVPAAQAWAHGDLEGMIANYSEQRFESCIQAMPSFLSLFQRAVKDSVGSVEGALGRPGKTVIAMSVGALLRKDGVLDRLEAEGYRVEPPGTW